MTPQPMYNPLPRTISPLVIQSQSPVLKPSQIPLMHFSPSTQSTSQSETPNDSSKDTFKGDALIPSEKAEYTLKVKDLRAVCDAFDDLPDETTVLVNTGRTFDLRSVQIKKHVPATQKFRIFTFKNPKSKRLIKVWKCDHEDCGKHFRKWHNFFDHLRIHTNERPYVCPLPGCGFSFTQKANLNKHVEVHGGVKRFACPTCDKMFYTNFNLKVRHSFVLIHS